MIDGADDKRTCDRILDVTAELIKKEGVSAVTTRKVAELANVNIASINYHFRSKDMLVYAAIMKLFSPLKDAFMLLDDISVPQRERLRNFLIEYARGMLKYPQPLKHFFIAVSSMSENRDESMRFHKQFEVEKLEHVISGITGCKDPTRLRVMKSQLIYAAIMPGFISLMTKPLTEAALPDIKTQIEILIEQYFG
ncbi:MAG: TetR/AcrR family transcriptional regulator [Clostridiaceae bacterium]